ncbi:MAG: response regulator [Chitinophagaceae bacterium]
MKRNPIVIIDDDEEDLILLKDAANSLQIPNEVVAFEDTFKALAFLRQEDTQPFFILCDINMQPINGIDLREEMFKDERLRLKSIPFLFLSTGDSHQDIKKAYSLAVQGYFKKPESFEGIKKMLQCIINYWGDCRHPNSS